MAHPNWTRKQQLLAFRLYCRTPFGRLHRSNPDIIALADRIGRTPSAVAMKACNFASLDPQQVARGITGLSNVSNADRELWEQFAKDSEAVTLEVEQAYSESVPEDAQAIGDDQDSTEVDLPTGPTETERTVRARRVQRFFRDTVLVSYEGKCAITGLAVPELLNASHIVPWSEDADRRADPRNGLCLNAFHDRAFDRGFIALDESLRVIVSPEVEQSGNKDTEPVAFHREQLLALAGREITAPVRFAPDREAIRWHRERVLRV